ncbi:MAG: TraR/DksA family transcriptional regulator [Planctomycetota bacterium]
MVKKLTKKELESYRGLLMQKRNFVTGNMVNLEDEVRSNNGAGPGGRDAASGDEADLGAETFEQDFALSLLENEVNVVQKIDEALERLDKGDFGICRSCRKQIVRARLKAIPWTSFCIECQRKEEAF